MSYTDNTGYDNTGYADDDSGSSAAASSADPAGTDPFVSLTITPDTGLGFVLETMEATEELGRPFLIVLDVSAATPKNDLHTLLGSTATVKLTYPEKDPRYFSGVVARVQYRGLSGGGYKYRVELRPWIWLLSQQQDCRIFQSQSPWQIMTQLFRDAGFTSFADKRQNAAGDTELRYCVQYRETTLDFVTRLMEQYGLYYFVTHADGSHTINFADDPNSHTSAGAAIPYRYDETGWRAVEDHLWDWSADARIEPGACTFRDHAFNTPKADMTVKSQIAGGHTYGTSEFYDYPGGYFFTDDGQKLVQVRMQDFDTRRQVYGGTSNSRKLGAGVKFTMSDFPDSAGNQEYLVTQSVCTVARAETRAFQDQDEIIDTFRCVLRAVPGSRPFRLPEITPKPRISGSQTAKVVGESGQEITTEVNGRIKIKFHWDRSTGEDENSSCWVRVAQTWAGLSWGSMFIPRIGMEVVVEFGEGNPDRPMVTGVVYNADNTPPYALPDNKTRSTIKSNSSLNGGGFNEFRFEDKKGSEEVFFQAQKDFNETILNSHTATIGQDTTTTVQKGNRSVTVSKGNDTHTVTEGDRTVTVSKGDDTHTVTEGDRTVTVSGGDDTHTVSEGARSATVSKGNETLTVTKGDMTVDVTAGTATIKAGTKIALQVGGNSIEITTTTITLTQGGNSIELGSSGVTVKGTNVKATADMAAEISGLTAKLAGSTTLELEGSVSASLKGLTVAIN